MTAIFIHDGTFIDHVPASPVPAGGFVRLGGPGSADDAVGVAPRPIAAGHLGSVAMSGVFQVPCRIVGDIGPGTRLFLDLDGEHVTDETGPDRPYVGISLDASVPGQPALLTELRLRLNH